jgi:hypothetical protein
VLVAARHEGAAPLTVLAVAVPAGVALYGAFALFLMRDRFALLNRLIRGH